MRIVERLKAWLDDWDSRAARARRADPDWIEWDQHRRLERFKKGIRDGIAYLSVGGYESYECQHMNIRWKNGDKVEGEWEVIVRRTDL